MQDAHPLTWRMKRKLAHLMHRLCQGDWYGLSIEEWQNCRVAERMGLARYIEPVKIPDGLITLEVMDVLREQSKYKHDHFELTPLGFEIVHGNWKWNLLFGLYRLRGERTFLQLLWDILGGLLKQAAYSMM